MRNVSVSFKTDKLTKREAQKLVKKIGFSLTDILNTILYNFVITKKLKK